MTLRLSGVLMLLERGDTGLQVFNGDLPVGNGLGDRSGTTKVPDNRRVYASVNQTVGDSGCR